MGMGGIFIYGLVFDNSDLHSGEFVSVDIILGALFAIFGVIALVSSVWVMYDPSVKAVKTLIIICSLILFSVSQWLIDAIVSDASDHIRVFIILLALVISVCFYFIVYKVLIGGRGHVVH